MQNSRMGKSRERFVLWSLRRLMEKMDRADALEEATFTSIETVVHLMHARDARGNRRGLQGLEPFRKALASARATVVAVSYVLTETTDAERRNKENYSASPISRHASPWGRALSAAVCCPAVFRFKRLSSALARLNCAESRSGAPVRQAHGPVLAGGYFLMRDIVPSAAACALRGFCGAGGGSEVSARGIGAVE